jgi:signal transduction histidine kinase
MQQGLSVIASRAESLSRFMSAYARLAKLPEPTMGTVNVAEWVQRVAGLETRLPVAVEAGPELTVQADGDQLEQLLINLIRNAADAADETGGGVRVGWSKNRRYVEVWVEDDGPGLSSEANLFVPFFTTKPGGSGIGLVLCRKITEAHGGSLTLENRRGPQGCVAKLRLPLETAA